MSLSLPELAVLYGVDKLHSHSYIPFYEQLFAGREVKRLLEIGIGYEDLMKPFVPFYVHGASLKMWADLWPEAQIWSCDIRKDVLLWEPKREDGSKYSIYSLQIDQSSREDLAALVSLAEQSAPWDIVIDDGSHQAEHQIITAEVLLPSVRPGGVYIIEDVQEPERVAATIPGSVIHRFNKRPDDVLVVKEVA